MNRIGKALLAISLVLPAAMGPLARPASAATAAELNANGQAALHRLYAQSTKAVRFGQTAHAVLVFPKIVKAGYPDATAWTKGHHYFDPDSREDNPTWYMVDIGFVERFPAVVSLETLKTTPGLDKMVVTQKGSRLSVQPVTKGEYDIVCRLGRKLR